MMTDILKAIIATKRHEVDVAKRILPSDQIEEMMESMPAARSFYQSLRAKIDHGNPAVIAEIKKASPSKGVIRENFDPVAIATDYASAGAACLSVLTDRTYFMGSDKALMDARAATALPVIRKDFIIDEYQVFQSRLMGADCILLIAACLSLAEMLRLESLAESLGLAVVVEVHDEAEVESALQLKTPLIGINNRNLKTFEVSLDSTIRLSRLVPSDRTVIAESGISNPNDVAALRSCGIHAFLVGEAFMRAKDPGQELRRLFS
jgi:indole-3-glycerol phosphate synthase